MKKVLSMSSVLAVGVGASAAYWLSNKPNRVKAEMVLNDIKQRVMPSVYAKADKLPIKKGGNPDPKDAEDNNMVNEGAMTSVRFYNEKMQ